MSEFKIQIGTLKSRNKAAEPAQVAKVDAISEELGFVAREAPKKRGRKPSPRTGQVHAKVFPEVAEEISNEARRRGVQQGVLIEEAWAIYKLKSGI